MPRTTKGLAGLMALVFLSGVALAAILFSTTIPQITVTGAASNCANPTLTGGPTIQGQSGRILVDCNGVAAFTISGQDFDVTPTFTLPSGYVGANLYPFGTTVGAGSTCAAALGSANIPITSGTGVVLSPQGYNYCLDYSNTPNSGLASFTITWSG